MHKGALCVVWPSYPEIQIFRLLRLVSKTSDMFIE